MRLRDVSHPRNVPLIRYVFTCKQGGDWICLAFHGSFFSDEENGVESGCNAQCAKAPYTSLNCISQLHQNLFDLNEDDKYLCPECYFEEPKTDDS